MLQINSGKLFTRGVARRNQLRGVLYSNAEFRFGEDIVTRAGTLRVTDGVQGSRTIIYEIEELIEATEDGNELLISHTIAPYLIDFSALATFGLKAIFSPNDSAVLSLTSTEPSLASYHSPRQFIDRIFESSVVLKEGESASFVRLTDQIIALERKVFLAVMRAIRTYVAALHRMRDDLALAYTLFVTAIESLAQQFDGYETEWNDLDQRKTQPVDRALQRASPRTSQKVRDAIISSEHASLARRYRAFAMKHIDGRYFRDPSVVSGAGIARHELDYALREAYALRSRYVHNVKQIPDALTLAGNKQEVVRVDRKPVLTFQGLARLSHHVIVDFIKHSSKVDREDHDYSLERSGIVRAELAPQYWVAAPLRRAKDARKRLEGHLEQFTLAISRPADRQLTDLRPIFPDILRQAKREGEHQRRALLTLYALFASVLPKDERSAPLDQLLEEHQDEIGAPSSEAVVLRTLFGTLDAWSLEEHQEALDKYFDENAKPSGIQAPKLLDAAMCLALSERYRLEGFDDNARLSLARAVESYPGNPAILAIEDEYCSDNVINWRGTLFPASAED
jgi:hypothetical protein